MALTKVIRPLIDSNTLIEITSAITPKVYITNIFYTDQNYANTNFGSVDYNTGGYVKILGRGFQNNANVFVDTDEVSSYYVNLNEYRIQVPPKANGDYDLSIYNRNGRNVKKLQAIKYTDGPITIPGTYTLTASPGFSVNEGNILTIRLNTTLVPQQTVIPYVISGVSSADINGESLFGNLVVLNNEAVKEIIISADLILEGNETLTFSLPTITGTPSVSVTINDTSFPIPTYNFVGLPFSVDEGSIQYINVATSNVATSTTLYWTLSHLTTDGDDFTDNFGSFEITSNTGSFFIETIDDLVSEGNETFRIQLRTGSITGNLVRTSNTITINDTSLQPFYSVSQNTTNINEGQSVLFEIDTLNVLNGTTLYWTIRLIDSIITTNDFITPSNGSITIFGGVNSVLITANTDANTEGSEVFNLQLRTDSISGNIVANSSTITILDTSKDPSYIITPNVSSFNENSSVLFTVTTTDVTENTVLYWTLQGVTGNVNANDFLTPNSGSITIPSNGISKILLSANTDANTEGNEIFKLQLRTDSLTGNVVNTSANVTLVDSSQNPNYIITPNTSIVNEGNTVVFTITTTDVTDGTTVYYTTQSITGNVNSDDFTSSNTGSITITYGTAEVALTTNEDLTVTENDEIFRLQLRSGSISGDVINVSSNVTISDTSNVPVYNIISNTNSVLESRAVLFTVQTNAVPDGTVLYWTTESLGGSVTSDDFLSANTGSVVIVSGVANFQLITSVDIEPESDDSFRVNLRTESISGNIVSNTSTIVINPLPYNYGWSSGGDNTSAIQRLDFSNDTTSVRGNDIQLRVNSAGVSNYNFGWFAGGGPPATSLIRRLTFSNDVNGTSTRSPLSVAKFEISSVSNLTYGWFAGGGRPSPAGGYTSVVERLTFSNDVNGTSTRGPLTSSLADGMPSINNSTYGWLSFLYFTGWQRLTFSNDLITTTPRSTNMERKDGSVTDQSTYGWTLNMPSADHDLGGLNQENGPSLARSNFSRISRLTFANDTANASVRANLSLMRQWLTTFSSPTNGYFGAGHRRYYDPGPVAQIELISYISRLTFANDTLSNGNLLPLRAFTTAFWGGAGVSGNL